MIQFKKIIIHNFGSYHHAELNLQNKGFCLVSGQNNYAPDNALSNGVGKSLCFSAILWVLTGETVSGVKTGLRNINTEENECWAELSFIYNKDSYIVTRILAPKVDLKIIKNDVDVSGKGVRESEKRLVDLLPEITKDLITSCIIVGQGMPNKFSSFSPSGRKELLEKLTKSDFMIEDIKRRILSRQTELSTKIREYEDSLIANTTQLNISSAKLTDIKQEFADNSTPDFETPLLQQRTVQKQLIEQQDNLKITRTNIEEQLQIATQKLFHFTEAKANENAQELTLYNAKYNELSVRKNTITLKREALVSEIKKLKAITDTCPTCGQKLLNVQIPDTSKQEAEVSVLDEQIIEVTEQLKQVSSKHQQYLLEIDNRYEANLSNINNTISSLRENLASIQKQETFLQQELEKKQSQINKLIFDQQHWAQYIKKLEADIAAYQAEIASINNIISITTTAKDELINHLAVVKKMDTLVKRDFRGYLLTNIINYLDKKAKEFCAVVFGTQELSLCLNGNALDITYCNKAFDLLSGGEKQRVDLILQLAIRDLLIAYLDLDSNILVLDEITDFLDRKSCKAVMNLLENTLHTVESVFIISHRSADLEIPLDNEILIIKNKEGISELTGS